jgi:hypothetical protein
MYTEQSTMMISQRGSSEHFSSKKNFYVNMIRPLKENIKLYDWITEQLSYVSDWPCVGLPILITSSTRLIFVTMSATNIRFSRTKPMVKGVNCLEHEAYNLSLFNPEDYLHNPFRYSLLDTLTSDCITNKKVKKVNLPLCLTLEWCSPFNSY